MKTITEFLLKLKFTAAGILLLCLFTSRPARASGICSVFDGAGHLLEIEEGSVSSTGDVIFEFDTSLLSEDESFAFTTLDESGEESLMLPITNGEWVVEEGDDVELKFYILDEKDGAFEPLDIFPDGICSVFFMKNVRLEVETSFNSGEGVKSDGITVFRGEAPELKVSPQKGLFTFVRITDKAGSKTYEVTEENTRFQFNEGSYGIAVWCENGRGESAFMSLPVSRFIYDNTPPPAPELYLEGDSPEEEASGIYAGNVKLTPKSSDLLSGTDTYLFAFSDGSISRGSSLVLEPDTTVNIVIYALDKAGNLSKGVEIGRLILDATAPLLTSDRINTDGEKISIELGFEDSLSGIKSLNLFVDGEKTLSRSFPEGRESFSLRTLLSPDDLPGGSVPIKAVASDRAGNRAVYGFELKNEDQTAPVIKMEGIDNLALLSHGADLICTCEDSDSGIERASVTIEKRDEAGVSVWIREVSPGTIRFQEDGNYSVRFTAVDKAGNRTERSRSFTIDNSPPLITSLEAYHKKVLSSFSFPEDPGKYVSDYTFVTYQLYLNGREYDGRTVSSPGKYVLRLCATDEFGRESQEKAEFLISSNEAEEPDLPLSEAAPEKLPAVKAAKTRSPAKTVKKGNGEVKKTTPPSWALDTDKPEETEEALPEEKLSLSERFFRWLDKVLPFP